MIVRDLAQKFMNYDPKARCRVYSNDKLLYNGRIEFLYNCDNPLEELKIVHIGLDTTEVIHGKYGDFAEPIIEIIV